MAGRPFPLVLLDASMPEMDGFALAAKIQQSPRLAGASIMMLTSGARPGDRARCFELGISAYLTKPVKQSDLLDTIVSALVSGRGGRKERPRARGPRRSRAGSACSSPRTTWSTSRSRWACSSAPATRRPWPRTAGRSSPSSRRETFDVVLMDVQMPEMDGFEATSRHPRAGAGDRRPPPDRGRDRARDEGRRRALPRGGDGRLPGQAPAASRARLGDRGRAPRRRSRGRRRSACPRPRPRRGGRRRSAAPRARGRRPEGPGRPRADLPRRLAEAGRATPGGRPAGRRRRATGVRPRPQGIGRRTSPPRSRPRPPCACRRWARRAGSPARPVPSSTWNGRSMRFSPPWPASSGPAPGPALPADRAQSRYFTNTTSLWASL